jgi:hypothetical protein
MTTFEMVEAEHGGKIFQVEVFWLVTPCSVVVGYQRFRGPSASILREGGSMDL